MHSNANKTERAQRIVDDILESDRYKNSHTFEDRLFTDEPILRTGAQAYGRHGGGMQHAQVSPQRPSAGASTSETLPGNIRPIRPTTPKLKTTPTEMPERIRKMRRLGRGRHSMSGAYGAYTMGSSKLFYEQGKFMEDYEDNFDGEATLQLYYPTYDELSTYQLRCYFSWRTKYRNGVATPTSTSFLFMHAYELLCGIGVSGGMEGFEALRSLSEAYRGMSAAFDSHMKRWLHDYVVFHGLDKGLLEPLNTTFPVESVGVLVQAEEGLLKQKDSSRWPDAPTDGLPSPEELLDALCSLSRYRAEKSRYVRMHREDVALVAARVFAHMVAHCSKRRKTGFVEGLFGGPTLTSYTVFPSAVFWSPNMLVDTVYEAGPSEKYECKRGFWWRSLPCRRLQTSKELGALMHAIDARMRIATADKHPLKEKPLPKYQGKFIDEEIAALIAQREAEEKARIVIDRSALVGIRSASVRTREALLTEEEREEEPLPVVIEEPAPEVEEMEEGGLDLTAEQRTFLDCLLEGTSTSSYDALFVSLAVDAINEVFLEIIGDTVIEFDGETPSLVEDYVDDVRDEL